MNLRERLIENLLSGIGTKLGKVGKVLSANKGKTAMALGAGGAVVAGKRREKAAKIAMEAWNAGLVKGAKNLGKAFTGSGKAIADTTGAVLSAPLRTAQTAKVAAGLGAGYLGARALGSHSDAKALEKKAKILRKK